MAKNKRNSSPIWIAVGLILILSAALMIGKNLLEQKVAEKQSSSLLEQAEQQLEQAEKQQEQAEAPLPLEVTPSEPPETPAANWSNYNIAGILSIPDLGLKLPVLADYSDALLKVSVCLFDWEDTQDPPRMVIAGHNYKSHFGNISKLTVDSIFTYQEIDGEECKFRVKEITEIDADQGDALGEGEWDLTLLTCNFDMSKRILVRCVQDKS